LESQIKRLGELPVAYIQLHPDTKISILELLNYAKENISEKAAVPQHIEIIQTMPLTSVGKIFKPALRILATQQLIDEELSVLKAMDVKFEVTVNLDNENGLIATITVGDDVKDEVIKRMQTRLEDFLIKLEFKQHGKVVNADEPFKKKY